MTLKNRLKKNPSIVIAPNAIEFWIFIDATNVFIQVNAKFLFCWWIRTFSVKNLYTGISRRDRGCVEKKFHYFSIWMLDFKILLHFSCPFIIFFQSNYLIYLILKALVFEPNCSIASFGHSISICGTYSVWLCIFNFWVLCAYRTDG